MPLPFSDIRVVDCASGVAGPMATMLLADFGAEVVKVEPPGGERARKWRGYPAWNRNKRRVELDIHRPEGLEALRRLVEGADVAVFDEPPGQLERLGLDAVTLTARHPALIHAWLPPYGTGGRWSQLPPDELLQQALSGVSWLQQSFAKVPVNLVTPQIGYAHATIAANALAAALWERRRSGRGQGLTVSGLHAVSSIEGAGLITAGGAFRAGRNSLGGAPNYRLYECADGTWLFLGTLTQQFFLKALDAIDCMDVLFQPGVDGELVNLFRDPELAEAAHARLEARFREEPREHWLKLLGEADVPRGPAGDRHEWFRSETVAANRMRVTVDDPDRGTAEIPGVPVVLETTPGSVRHAVQPISIEDVGWEPRAGTPAAEPALAGRPLEGVRVVDLGAFIAGTFAPTVLANFGADVIKVEPLDGDPFRTYGLSSYGHNFGKRSICLDLKSPGGRTVLEALVRTADVVLDNYRLGVRERLGIDYASLKAINPRIITCSVTGYGPTGPYAQDPGFDPLLQARSGMMAAQGGADEPVFHQIAVNDTASAMVAAFGIQAALHARELTGEGQEVHTCLANQTILFQSGEVTTFAGAPEAPLGGRDHPGPSALRRLYRCADGWIAIAATAPAHFHAVCRALGHLEWAGRTIAEQALLEPNSGALATSIAEALAEMPVRAAVDRLLAHGAPAAPVFGPPEIFHDPWLRSEGLFQEIDDPQFGPMTTIRTYADWSRSIGGFPRRTPMLGEHTIDILDELGFGGLPAKQLFEAGAVK